MENAFTPRETKNANAQHSDRKEITMRNIRTALLLFVIGASFSYAITAPAQVRLSVPVRTPEIKIPSKSSKDIERRLDAQEARIVALEAELAKLKAAR